MYLRKYIPACETFGWVGGPEFMTRIVEMRNGRERRNAEWANARHRFQLPYGNRKSSDYAKIKSHHLVCRGRLHNFLYQDRLDHSAQAAVFGIAEAGQTAFQLGKTSELDGVSYFREVNCLYRPDPASPGDALEVVPTIMVDGTPTTAFSIDPDTGAGEFDSPLTGGEILTWSGEFSIWVRYDNDHLPWSIDNRFASGSYAINGTVDLIEMPPPVPESSS